MSSQYPPREISGHIEVLTVTRDWSRVVITILIVVALGYWLWTGLTQKSINGDDGISVMASISIAEHGYPLLPSGFIYDRGYVPNYLIAGSILVFGLNDLSIMFPSLLMALGALWLVYRFGKDVIGKPWIGVAAAALLIALQAQTFYATSPRMYMPLQFFTMLAVYSAWRGYVGSERKFKLVTILAAIAAMLSHREGVSLAVALPLSILIITWLIKQKRPSIYTFQNLVAAVLLGLVALIVYEYTPPRSFVRGNRYKYEC